MRTEEVDTRYNSVAGISTRELIERAKKESKFSAFLTPWGLREIKKMNRTEIADVFGFVESEVAHAMRVGKIVVRNK